MKAPTMLPSDDGVKIYHVGDTIVIKKALRLFGNVASATAAGLAFQLPIKIGDDVGRVSIECAGNNNLITYSGTRLVDSKAVADNSSYYINGGISSYELGLMSVVFYHPSASSTQVMCYAALAGSDLAPIYIHFLAPSE